MSDNSNPAYKIGSAICIVAAVIGCIAYGIAYNTSYDTSIRHFDASPAVTVFVAALSVCVVAAVISALFLKRRGNLISTEPTHLESFMLWLAAFIFISFGVVLFGSGDTVSSSTVTTPALAVICRKATPYLTILSGIPLAMSVSSRFRRTTIHAVSSFVPVLWSACLLFKYYFDLDEMPLNDPELALTSLCISGMIVFFLAESRDALGINTPAISLFSNLICITLTGCVASARIVLSITSSHTLPSLTENVMFFTVGAVALARLISLGAKIPERESAVSEFDELYPSDPE